MSAKRKAEADSTRLSFEDLQQLERLLLETSLRLHALAYLFSCHEDEGLRPLNAREIWSGLGFLVEECARDLETARGLVA